MLILQGFFNYVSMVNMALFKKNNIYLDSASGAILNKQVLFSMHSISKTNIANPASNHSFGQNAKIILETSRLGIAQIIGAHADEIIFTSCGSESIALSLMGTVYKAKIDGVKLPHIITTTIEHSAVLNTCRIMKERGDAEITYITPCNVSGLISIDDIKDAIKENTVIISIHMVNNEIGIIQPIPELLKIADSVKEKKYNITRMRFSSGSYYPYIHIDAAQAYPHMDLSSLIRSGVDMISFNSVKIGGPSGIGALYKKRSVKISPIIGGGDQEFTFRPGTQSPILAYGFMKASQIMQKNINKNENNYKNLKEYFLNKLERLSKEENFQFHENSSHSSIPSIISISFPYFTGDQFAIELNARGIAISSKSACNTEDNKESMVIEKIRNISKSDTYKDWGTIRISFSPDTKIKHINKLLRAIKDIVHTYRTVLY